MTPEELDSLRLDYDVVPLVRELSADAITPVVAFEALAGRSGQAFLFESVERGENVGRYSFVGFHPRRSLRIERGASDPIALLREELRPLRVHGEAALPPFFGGAVGFFGYGISTWSERIPDRHAQDGEIADAVLLFFDSVVVFDHVRQNLYVIANMLMGSDTPSSELLASAGERLDLAVASLRAAVADLIELPPAANVRFESNMSRGEFEGLVVRAKEEIVAGEIFQVVLSQRWSSPYPTSEALTLYRALRSINPSPYMFLLRTSDCTLVGASPEMLVRASGDFAETRPIAGTRRRGATPEEDAALESELLADPKENAEHLMLVDLGRNDLGRVCRAGSVEVGTYCRVERYSHVMHLVTDVSGRLRPGRSAIDLLLSCFPAGTLSGAPKIRAMEIVDELEPQRRGPYGGAVAYIGFSGNLDSCITIRTIVLREDVAFIQAGAGIVYDSDPATEYEETISKSAALRKAIGVATAVLARS
jgi:anthranilate synthase component 1